MRNILRGLAFTALTGISLSYAACVTRSDDDMDDVPVSFAAWREHLLTYRPELKQFEKQGPFEFKLRQNVPIKLKGGGIVVGDLVSPVSQLTAPLVVIVHGNHARKEAHRYQAMRLASFGMHALVVQMVNRDQWLKNGELLAKVISKIHENSELLSQRIDRGNIILVGHSFGGSAVSIAAAKGAPVRGIILLDPAIVSSAIKDQLQKIRVPAILLGADRSVFRSRQRRLFYRVIGGEMAEISIAGATHDDAQYPSMFALTGYGIDPFTSRAKQSLFAAALTTSAFSLTATGGIDFAWEAFEELMQTGTIKNPKRRTALLDLSKN
jgi:dienelactone hydrolase